MTGKVTSRDGKLFIDGKESGKAFYEESERGNIGIVEFNGFRLVLPLYLFSLPGEIGKEIENFVRDFSPEALTRVPKLSLYLFFRPSVSRI